MCDAKLAENKEAIEALMRWCAEALMRILIRASLKHWRISRVRFLSFRGLNEDEESSWSDGWLYEILQLKQEEIDKSSLRVRRTLTKNAQRWLSNRPSKVKSLPNVSQKLATLFGFELISLQWSVQQPQTIMHARTFNWTRCYTEHQRPLWLGELCYRSTHTINFHVNYGNTMQIHMTMRVKMALLYDGIEQDATNGASIHAEAWHGS